MKLHTAVARTLLDCGVERVFGLLGDANMQYMSQFIDAGGRFVNAVHEGGAVAMADGCSRMSNHVEVASVTCGPGVTNTITALTEAARAGSPVLVLTGDTPARRDFVQYIDLRAVSTVCDVDFRKVLTPEHVVDDIANALHHVATTRRPMLLDIGAQLLGAEVDYQPSKFAKRPVVTAQADPESLDRALGILASARRPVVLAGVGAARSGAHDALVALARQLGAPLATSLLAKDMFAGDEANLGVFGTLSHDVATEVLAAADCVVAFGASLNHYTAAHGDLLRGKAVIHCDVRPQAIGRYSAVDAGLVGDARLVAEAMTESLRAAEIPSTGYAGAELQERLDARDPAAEFADASTETTLDMRTAALVLDELLPRERAVVTDCGRFMQAPWRYLGVGGGGLFQHTVNFGSIGLGLATSIGAAVARDGQLTVAVTGDGGLMMNVNELTTAVREGLSLVVVVFNDGSYGAEWTKLKDAGLDPKHSLISWPELAGVATGLGGHAVTVRTRAELEEAARLADSGPLPLLIDVKCDPAVDTGVLS